MTMISSIILLFSITTNHAQKREPVICEDYSQCDLIGAIDNPKVECTAAKSCESTQITSTGSQGYVKCSGQDSCRNANGIGIQTEESLFCSGYKSCEYAASLQAKVIKCSALNSCAQIPQITSDTLIYCGAQYSCYNSGLIAGTKAICEGFESCKQSTIVSGDDVQCNGDKGCAEAAITTPGTVKCLGIYSCQDATIRANVSVQLFGAFAANGAHIRDTPLIEGYGDTVLKNSIIDSGSLLFITVKLYGFTAYNTQNPNVFICRNGAECDLHCIASGCNGLEFRCLSGSTCNIYPSGCEENAGQIIDGVICPSLTDGTSKPLEIEDDAERILFGVHDNDMATKYASNERFISTEIRIECNFAQQCAGQTIGLRTDTDPIIQCGGYGSCDAAKLTLRYDLGEESEIQCQGENSCIYGDMIATYGTVACDGEFSCASAPRIRAQGINCYGKESCQESNMGIIENGSLPFIECRGTASCRFAEIRNRWGTTYCTGTGGCYNATIQSQFDIQCLGHDSCSDANIATNGGIMCNGDIACNGIRVDFIGDTDYFAANGYLAAHQAAIYGADGTDILGLGYKSLAFSTIDSDDSALIQVDLYGHLAGYSATYICRSGSQCNLTCRGETCTNMEYICEAGSTCIIEPAGCDSTDTVDGVICPSLATDVLSKDIDELLEGKEALREEDEVWQEIQNEIEVSMARFGMGGVIDEVRAKQSEQDEERLLFGDIQVGDSNVEMTGGMILGIVGIVFVIGLAYFWWRLRVKEREEYKVIY